MELKNTVEGNGVGSVSSEGTDLRAQYEELKKSNPALVEETKKVAKGEKPKSKPRKEVTPMTDREKAEAVLAQVCKDLKLGAPVRIQAKGDSKSGKGALKAFLNGNCKVSIRSNDVVIYTPVSELGYGKVPKGWEHCAQLRWDDPNLDKAIRKGLKDKRSNAEWIREISPAMRKVDRVTDLVTRKAKLEAELDAIKKAEAAKAKATPVRKAKAKIKAAVKGVSATVEAAAAMVAGEVAK